MIKNVISPEFNEEGRALRRVRSFVRRQGRLTPRQEQALEKQWPIFGIEYQPEPIDFSQVFGRNAPVVRNWFWNGRFVGDYGKKFARK